MVTSEGLFRLRALLRHEVSPKGLLLVQKSISHNTSHNTLAGLSWTTSVGGGKSIAAPLKPFPPPLHSVRERSGTKALQAGLIHQQRRQVISLSSDNSKVLRSDGPDTCAKESVVVLAQPDAIPSPVAAALCHRSDVRCLDNRWKGTADEIAPESNEDWLLEPLNESEAMDLFSTP